MIKVTGTETLEEVYFLIRVGTWHQEHLHSYLAHRSDLAYTQGIDDTRQDGYTGADVDDAFNRGFDQGHNEGYKDGFADGSREASYDQDPYR